MSIEAMKQALERAERKLSAYVGVCTGDKELTDTVLPMVRQAIEEAEKQESVAWGVDWGKAGDTPCVSIIKRKADGGIEVMAVEYAPYTHPQPKREPLTDEQIDEIWSDHGLDGLTPRTFARAIEAAHGIKGDA